MSAVGMITKWLVVPLSIGALGYFVLGPRFGGDVATKMKESGVPISMPTSYPKPKVTVTARKVGGSIVGSSGDSYRSSSADEKPKQTRRRRRRRRTRRPVDTTQPPTTIQSTEGTEPNVFAPPTDDNPKPSTRKRRKNRRKTPPNDLPPEVPNDQPPVIDTGN